MTAKEEAPVEVSILVSRPDGSGYIAGLPAVRQKFYRCEALGFNSEESYDTLENLVKHMQRFCHKGLCVIVRPCFNDLMHNGEVVGFREWRSFNGAPLEQVDFYSPGKKPG